MNKQHKFRAYSTKRNQFVFLELENGTGDVICALADGTQDGTALDTLDLQPWQEATGLKDKNGKEINEGDLLKSPINGVGEVLFERGCFVISLADVGLCDLSVMLDNDEYEIIGNIYENPELIGNFPANSTNEEDEKTTEEL